jgi:hypothetical protein
MLIPSLASTQSAYRARPNPAVPFVKLVLFYPEDDPVGSFILSWYAFTFGTLRITSAEERPAAGREESLVAVLTTDVGDVVVQLFGDR